MCSFATPFIQKIVISHTPNKRSKYDAGKEGRTGTPKPCDARKRKISMFATCTHGADLGCLT